MTDLVDIGDSCRLAPAPAASWLRAAAAGCPLRITSSYRDPATATCTPFRSNGGTFEEQLAHRTAARHRYYATTGHHTHDEPLAA